VPSILEYEIERILDRVAPQRRPKKIRNTPARRRYAAAIRESEQRAIVRDTNRVTSEEASNAYARYLAQPFNTAPPLQAFARQWHPLHYQPDAAYNHWTTPPDVDNKLIWSCVHRCSQPDTVAERLAMYETAAVGFRLDRLAGTDPAPAVDRWVLLHTSPESNYVQPVSDAATPLTAEQRRLVEEHDGLVHAIVEKMYKEHYAAARRPAGSVQPIEGLLDGDDLISEGMVALCDAATRYDRQKGKFSTFAWRRIEGHLIDIIRRAERIPLPKGSKPGDKIPVGGFAIDEDGNLIGDEASVSYNPASDESLDRIDGATRLDRLKPLARDILKRKGKGQTDKQIAAVYGLSARRIGQIKNEAVADKR
jgi:RNA polymerase sigma factor for flagellar operon FliA